tara:strand:- start:49 stop:918 length:870 start_codon:yes stop_codon:yes gene_type:complete
MACPICKQKKILYSIKVKDYEYNLKTSAQYNQCSSCETIYRNYPSKIKKNLQKKYYHEKSYFPLKGGIIYDFLKKIYASYEIKKISYIVGSTKVEKVLDIACGKGYLIKKMAQNNLLQCYGTDAHIKPRNENNVKFIKSSFNNYRLIKKIKPDLIIINNFIEHVEDINKINKVISSMKKKSLLIIVTPDSNSLGRKIFSNYWSGYHAPRHKTIFNDVSLQFYMSKNKKIKYSLKKIYDPFANIISLRNSIKNISLRYFFQNIFQVIFFSFFMFIDLFRKNRILMKVVKL